MCRYKLCEHQSSEKSKHSNLSVMGIMYGSHVTKQEDSCFPHMIPKYIVMWVMASDAYMWIPVWLICGFLCDSHVDSCMVHMCIPVWLTCGFLFNFHVNFYGSRVDSCIAHVGLTCWLWWLILQNYSIYLEKCLVHDNKAYFWKQ